MGPLSDAIDELTVIPLESIPVSPHRPDPRHAADTSAASHLEMDESITTGTTLFNLSSNSDTNPGRLIAGGGTPAHTDPKAGAKWNYLAVTDLTLSGSAQVKVYVSAPDLVCDGSVTINADLRSTTSKGAGSATSLGSASAVFSPSTGGCPWGEFLVDIPVSGTVLAGEYLELTITTDGTGASIAYDTITYPATLMLLLAS